MMLVDCQHWVHRVSLRIDGLLHRVRQHLFLRCGMDLKLQRKRLNEAHERVAQKLADPNYLSEWMCFSGHPWVGTSFVDLRLDTDLYEIENITDEEVYELIRNKLIVNLENILHGLKE